MRKKVASGMILTLLLICTLTLALNVKLAKAAPQVSLLTHSGWLDQGHYHVSGEVKNVGDTAAGSITITATFYDSSNRVVATEFTFTELDVLLAGKKSPFEVLLVDPTQSSRVHRYSLSVEYSPTTSIPEGLQIVANSSYIDARGMHVEGGIRNVAAETQNYVKVVATFYNSTGSVVAIGSTYAVPSSVNAGKTGLFLINLTYTERVPLVASYALTAQSQQYAEVPEFPSITVLPLFMILTLLAIGVSRRKKL